MRDLSPPTTFFYQEFGAIIFVLNIAFFLFSAISFTLGDMNKLSVKGKEFYLALSKIEHAGKFHMNVLSLNYWGALRLDSQEPATESLLSL